MLIETIIYYAKQIQLIKEDLKTFAKNNQNDFEQDIVKLIVEIQKLDLKLEFILLGKQNQLLSSQDDQSQFEKDKKQSQEDFEKFISLLQAFGYLECTLEDIANKFQLLTDLIHQKQDNYQKRKNCQKSQIIM